MGTTAISEKKFALNKWFLDCVTENGDCFIIYAANLKWLRWSIDYSSTLIRITPENTRFQSKLRNVNFPVIEGERITWQDQFLKTVGIWEGMESKVEEKLFSGNDGGLYWNCLQPKALVRIKHDDINYDGFGYVEKLQLTTLPWNIPMDELRWGRFISKKYHIVWIEYKRERTKQWVWVNNELLADCNVSDFSLSHKNKRMHLSFDQHVLLEKEKKIFNVLKIIFRYLPGFNQVIPREFLNSDEKKWLSKSILTIEGREVAEGWSIHEYVNFKGT